MFIRNHNLAQQHEEQLSRYEDSILKLRQTVEARDDTIKRLQVQTRELQAAVDRGMSWHGMSSRHATSKSPCGARTSTTRSGRNTAGLWCGRMTAWRPRRIVPRQNCRTNSSPLAWCILPDRCVTGTKSSANGIRGGTDRPVIRGKTDPAGNCGRAGTAQRRRYVRSTIVHNDQWESRKPLTLHNKEAPFYIQS